MSVPEIMQQVQTMLQLIVRNRAYDTEASVAVQCTYIVDHDGSILVMASNKSSRGPKDYFCSPLDFQPERVGGRWTRAIWPGSDSDSSSLRWPQISAAHIVPRSPAWSGACCIATPRCVSNANYAITLKASYLVLCITILELTRHKNIEKSKCFEEAKVVHARHYRLYTTRSAEFYK